MPTLNIPPTVRFVLYLVNAVGSVVVAYLFAKGYVGEPETAAWAGLVAIISGIAAANTSITGAVVVDEEGAGELRFIGLVVVGVVIAVILLALLDVILV